MLERRLLALQIHRFRLVEQWNLARVDYFDLPMCGDLENPMTILGYSLTVEILGVIILAVGILMGLMALARRRDDARDQTTSICERLDRIAASISSLSAKTSDATKRPKPADPHKWP
ncbi:hypothetical protein ABIE41_001049 [Bosea sp. OAE506]|uniref:hypothetical protein n=1 Tax=Bosea sp. OAE506 TaxID=2663870 RepID=UPI00178A9AD9